MGLFGGILDVVKAPFDMADKLFKGDIDGFFTHPFEVAFEADIFFGMDLGDIASEVDDFLDQNPWLKTVIVSAGFAAGGVGGLVAAGAIAATDTASEINEGTFDIGDIGRGALEFGALYAGGAAGAGGGFALNTTASQVQAGTALLARSGLLGDAGRYVATAGAAYGGDWSSVADSARTAAIALRDTGLLGGDLDNVMNAVIAAADGDYASLQTAVQSGAQALRAAGLRGADPYLGAAAALAGNDFSDAGGTMRTVSGSLGDLGVLDEQTRRALETGLDATEAGLAGGLDDAAGALVGNGLLGTDVSAALVLIRDAVADGVSPRTAVAALRDSGAFGADTDRVLSVAQAVLASEGSD